MPFIYDHNAPEFQPGQWWTAADGQSPPVRITSVTPWANRQSIWHYEVWYENKQGDAYSKDLWNFQTRYNPPNLKAHA